MLLLVFPIYVGIKLIVFSGTIGLAMILSIVLNSIDVFATIATLIVASLMLMHRLTWPLLQRPIYAIQRMSLIRRKGWLWSVGVVLLTFAAVDFPGWVKTLIEGCGH
jgi:hypothetical protein